MRGLLTAVFLVIIYQDFVNDWEQYPPEHAAQHVLPRLFLLDPRPTVFTARTGSYNVFQHLSNRRISAECRRGRARGGVRDNRGTEFLLTFLENFQRDEHQPALFITTQSPTATVTEVDLERLAVELRGSEKSNKAIHVTSDEEIVIYGVFAERATSDAYLALPTDVLGTEYFVACMTPVARSEEGWDNLPTEFGVVGVYDGTTVTINPTQDVTFGGNNYPAGQNFTVSLDRFQTLQVQSAEDLTGSRITSSHPVSVLSGNLFTVIGNNQEGSGDYIVVMMPPVDTWGKEFVTAPLAKRTAGDIFRVVAARDNTTVTVTGRNPRNLDAGQFWEFEAGSNEYLHVTSNEPVLLVQYSKTGDADNTVTDPFSMIIPPVAQFEADYTFSTVELINSVTTHYVNLVIQSADKAGLIFDGQPLPGSTVWHPVPGTTYEATDLTISAGTHTATHSSPIATFGLFSARHPGLVVSELCQNYDLPSFPGYNHINPMPRARRVAYGHYCLERLQPRRVFTHLLHRIPSYGFASAEAYGYPGGLRLAQIGGACTPTPTVANDRVDNDCDGRVDEELRNGIDDDGDGLVDEDIASGGDGAGDCDVEGGYSWTEVDGEWGCHCVDSRCVDCPLGYLQCRDGEACLLAWKWCDGRVDCTDGSDEESCVDCPLGYLQCRDGEACLLAWKWCDGRVDCTDGSDEESCVEQSIHPGPISGSIEACLTIPGDFNNSRLAMLPNQLGQTTFEEIQNSSVAELLNINSSYGNPEGVHPEFGQFVSTILYPRCNVSDQNMCSSPGSADNICTGTSLLPCRSWCEEVLNDDRIRNATMPQCDVFPPTQHGCWNPEPEIKNNEVCYYGSGINYRGTESTNLSGAACVEWTAAQGGFYTTEYPWANLVHNYCRNPTGLERPFCITEDGSQEECDLIPCNADGCLDLGPPNYGRRSPGKRFYFVGERVAFTCYEGYSIKSGYTNEVRCIENGRWEHVKPICSVNMRGRLEKELLDVYSPNLAPEGNVLIGFTGSVEQIVDLDEKKEQLMASLVFQFTWQDSRLRWDPKYYDGIKVFSVPGSSIWTPALILKRNADPSYTGLEKSIPVQVNNNGVVTWIVETLTTTVCDADPFYFPVDTMECHICFSATAAIGQAIQCGHGNFTEDYSSSLSCDASPPAIQEGEWYQKDRLFANGNREACFAIQLERIPWFHIATTIGPCVILVITFVMPLDRGDRISFGVTILLSMVVSLVFVTDVLPVKGALPLVVAPKLDVETRTLGANASSPTDAAAFKRKCRLFMRNRFNQHFSVDIPCSWVLSCGCTSCRATRPR
ncbi:hypothetical protein Bbelb_271090 [Branchiostoma belcheri]|nr:hypothetical protein Bbelb_271090 [Branchiostoma belcheri]